MMRKLTCRLPFTTTGLGFSVNNFYNLFNNFSENCTIHQFYRYTLMQFELKCFKVHQKHYFFYPHLNDPISLNQNYKELIKEAEGHKKNFSSIVSIVESYGHFESQYARFCTILPPLSIHTPHTVRISNLRSVVMELAAGFDKEFINENTLPGAIYNAEGVLQNRDKIMPADYNIDNFRDDTSAVELAFSKLDPILDLASIDDCKFSVDGDSSSLVSTWIKDDLPYDRIPPIFCGHEDSPNEAFTSASDRTWYTITSMDYPSQLNYGILSYCGVWSEKLAKKWPDINVRYPGSSQQLSTACWSTVFDTKISKKLSDKKTLYNRGYDDDDDDDY